MLRILNYGYTNHRQQKERKSGWETLCFIYFFINWIFPFGKHETSLGILRVKPEVFYFFSRFLFTLSNETFFFFFFLSSSLFRYPKKIDSQIEPIWSFSKKEEGGSGKRNSSKSDIYWRRFRWWSLTFGSEISLLLGDIFRRHYKGCVSSWPMRVEELQKVPMNETAEKYETKKKFRNS